jgi:hypothetical protein
MYVHATRQEGMERFPVPLHIALVDAQKKTMAYTGGPTLIARGGAAEAKEMIQGDVDVKKGREC